MQIRDLKYLIGLLPAVVCFAGLYLAGWASPGLLYFAFIIVPLVELFVPASTYNDTEAVLQKKQGKLFFNALLYVQLPLLYGAIAFYIHQMIHASWSAFEIVGCTLNLGVLIGVAGINVAHELGHRQNAFDRWMTRLLLLPSFYSHFTLEHNYSHHLHVGTPEDAATARKNESLYAFYLRGIPSGYRHAWDIGRKLLQKANRPIWQHEMIRAHLAQGVYMATVIIIASWQTAGLLVIAGLWGVLFLETVNYIEHYGLTRKKLASGRYEPMADIHSWNSNHELGRVLLFELVRHADHHDQTTREYQTLRHLDKSPQLPFGYPMSIALAMIPPLWFRVMNPRVDQLDTTSIS